MTVRQRCFIQMLKLINYRCFPELVLNFHDRLTVFVAPNGGGKTAVLDGVAVALQLFVDRMAEQPGSKGFNTRDIRLALTPDNRMEAVTPVRLEAQGMLLDEPVVWSRQRQSEEASRTTTAEAQALHRFATRLVQQNQAWVKRENPVPPLFPLIAYYGTGRLWDMSRLTEGKRSGEATPNARHRGYTDCLLSSSHYKYFIDWFRRFSYEAKQEEMESRASPHNPQLLLSVVQKAVNTVLSPSEWRGLEWDFVADTVRASHASYGRLPVDSLSDGIRTMIGLVADIAHRAARLNPHLGENAAIETPGIVLIDEVDMHLHPEWQQLVLRSLLAAFPLVQFIVTTHSPQVLTTLRKENIRILACDENGKWTAREPATSPLARESGDALAYVMGTHPRPEIPCILPDIHDYEQLARAGRADSAQARQIKERLDAAGYEFGDAEQALFKFLAHKAANATAKNL